MLLGSVQMCGEKISSREVNDLCESLGAHAVRMLSLRHCSMGDEDFRRLSRSVGQCKAILQLNLNLGLVKTWDRARHLSAGLCTNRSLTSLFLHGSPIGDKGVATLCRALSMHPRIVSLDLGDCKLTDDSLLNITDLLPPNGAKRGLEELTLSANPGVTPQGWAKFFVTMSASCTLRSLSLDYNKLGDGGASCLAVALAARNSLQVVDVEGCGITEVGGRVLLHLVENFPTKLTHLILEGNKVQPQTLKAIKVCLRDNENGDDDDDDDDDDTTTTTTTQSETETLTLDTSSTEEDEELADVRVSPRESHVIVARTTPRGLVRAVVPPNSAPTTALRNQGFRSNAPGSSIPKDSWEGMNSTNSTTGFRTLTSSGGMPTGKDMSDLAFSGSPGGSTSLHLSQAYREVLN